MTIHFNTLTAAIYSCQNVALAGAKDKHIKAIIQKELAVVLVQFTTVTKPSCMLNILPRSPSFNSRPVHVEFLVDNVAQ